MSTTFSGTTSTGDGSPVAHRGGVVASLWFGMFVGALRLLGATEPAAALG
jgi:hypothetical protein